MSRAKRHGVEANIDVNGKLTSLAVDFLAMNLGEKYV
jgi:hypothetical protein